MPWRRAAASDPHPSVRSVRSVRPRPPPLKSGRGADQSPESIDRRRHLSSDRSVAGRCCSCPGALPSAYQDDTHYHAVKPHLPGKSRARSSGSRSINDQDLQDRSLITVFTAVLCSVHLGFTYLGLLPTRYRNLPFPNFATQWQDEFALHVLPGFLAVGEYDGHSSSLLSAAVTGVQQRDGTVDPGPAVAAKSRRSSSSAAHSSSRAPPLAIPTCLVRSADGGESLYIANGWFLHPHSQERRLV